MNERTGTEQRPVLGNEQRGDINICQYLTTEEAAAYLRRSVSWLLRQSDVPYLRGVPNTYRRADLDDWFERHKHQPQVG